MNVLVTLTGLALLATAAYSASDPMERSRNWVAPREWEERPEHAKAKQRQHAILMAAVVGGFGLALVIVGVFAT